MLRHLAGNHIPLERGGGHMDKELWLWPKLQDGFFPRIIIIQKAVAPALNALLNRKSHQQ